MKYSRLLEKWQTDSTLSRFYYLPLIFTSWQLTVFIVFLSKYFQLFVWILLNYPSASESDRVTTRKKAEHQKRKAGHPLRHLYDGEGQHSSLTILIGDTSVKMSLNLPSILVAVCKLVRPPPHIHKDKANVLDVAPDLVGLIC